MNRDARLFNQFDHKATSALLMRKSNFQDENLKEVHQMIEMEDAGVDQKLKALFEQLQQGKIDHGHLRQLTTVILITLITASAF